MQTIVLCTWEHARQVCLHQTPTLVRPIVSDVAKRAGLSSLCPTATGPPVTVSSSRSGALTSCAAGSLFTAEAAVTKVLAVAAAAAAATPFGAV